METWIENNWWWFLVITLWSAFWKALALWRSARKGDKVWFIVLLILNTAGILELFYLFYFSKKDNKSPESK